MRKNYLQLKFEKYPLVFTFFSCLVFILLRSFFRILHPHLWAEDGSLFLRDAIMYGWKSLTIPYAGYYHLIPRIFSYIIHFFPVATFPLLIFCSTTIIYISVLTMLVSEAFSDLIKERHHRYFIALALCMAPGLHEVLGNLANLHWILFLYIALYVLKKNETRINFYEIFFLLLSIFSTGESIVLLPVIIFQIIYQRILTKKTSPYLAFLFLAISVSVIFNLLQRGNLPSRPPINLPIILEGWHSAVLNTFFLQPLIGDKYLIKLFKNHWVLYYYGGSILGILLIGKLFLQKDRQLRIFAIQVILIACIPLLTFLVRPFAIDVYANVHLVWMFRYSFILAPWGILLYASVISTISSLRIKNYLYIAILVLSIFLNRYRFTIPAYGDEDWFAASRVAEQALTTGCPTKVSIPIYPDGSDGLNVRFYFNFELPEPEVPCK